MLSNGIEKPRELREEAAMRRMLIPLSFVIWTDFFSGDASAQSRLNLTLDPVLVNGTAADLLSQDSIVPQEKKRTDPVSSSGSVGRSLLTRTTLPITETGHPGEPSSVRGSARSADDVDARIFGVPINPPQGGGFNFSIFPSFLWSEVRYQAGPGLSGSEPRSITGQLQLIPRSFDALGSRAAGAGASQFYSSAGILQTAVQGSTGRGEDGSGIAAVLGVTEGVAKGPAGSLSATKNFGSYRIHTHLIATQQKAQSQGTESYVTPNATIENARVIPVFQLDTKDVQTTFFSDLARIDYRDPGFSLNTLDLVQQAGVNTIYKKGGWRFGLGSRYVNYRTRGKASIGEAIGNIQLTKTAALGDLWMIEPSIGGGLVTKGVTSFYFFPVVSVGLSRLETWGGEAYVRVGISRKVPSLLDRNYSLPGLFVPNPDLKSERVTTAILGWNRESGAWTTGIRFQGQAIQDARVLSGLQPINGGTATIASVAFDGGFQWTSENRLNYSFLVNLSEIESPSQGKGAFMGLPAWTQVGSWDWNSGRWGSSLAYRWTSGFRNSYGPSVGPTVYADWAGRYRVNSTLEIGARVDNLWDADVRLVADYPRLVRRFSLLLSATF